MVKNPGGAGELSRHMLFIRWLDSVTEEWISEWVEKVRDLLPAYSGMDLEEIRFPVRRHQEALRHYWDLGLMNLLHDFYRDLARKRLAEKVPLADVARAVAIGEDLLLERLESSGLPGLEDYRDILKNTFREGTFLLLDYYQITHDEMEAEAQARIEATRASAEKTREQWGLLNQILSGMDVGIILIDKSLSVVWLNRNLPRELLKVRPELAVGLPCAEALSHHESNCKECSVKDVIAGGSPLREVVSVAGASGTKNFLKITRPISGGNLLGPHAIEIYLDVTAQQETLSSLARTKELVRNILNSSVNGIISTDMSGRITLFNKTAERIFGFSEGEVLGMGVKEFYCGGEGEARRVMRRLLSDEVLQNYATSFLNKEGSYVPIRVTVSLLKDENDTLLGTMGFCQDMSTEEALKKEVADKDRYLLSILQASMDGLVTLDPQNRVASWNRGAASIFGVEPSSAVGHPMDEFLPPEKARLLPTSAALPSHTDHYEVRISRDKDAFADILVTRTAILDAEGVPTGASLVLKDVTEMKRLQTDLAEAEHLAELGRLAASVAHEIKNPIAGLRGAMEIMKAQHNLDDPRFSIFHEGLAQIRRLDSLVKDLLSFAKPFTVKADLVPLHLLAAGCLPFVEEQAAEAGVALHLDIPPDLPKVYADPLRFQQVIVNLIQNGIQSVSDGGEVRLTAFLSGDEVALEVKDTGCGISPSRLKEIFRPFFTTKHIGTGLGLSIVRRIVNAHGGRIEVSSKESEGTVFTVYLPHETGRE